MQSTPHTPIPEPDEHALEVALRQSRLEQLTSQAERFLRESREAVAESRRACARMAQAVRDARERLERSRQALRDELPLHQTQAHREHRAPAVVVQQAVAVAGEQLRVQLQPAGRPLGAIAERAEPLEAPGAARSRP